MRHPRECCEWSVIGRRTAPPLLLSFLISTHVAGQTVHGEYDRAALRSTASEASSASPEPVLPLNLVVPDILKPLVARMWRDSLTFRRQCARLAEHSEVEVGIELSRSVRDTRGARTLVSRHREELKARIQVELRKPALFVEHIAHELEHVLEQVDGTDLPRLARLGVDGVRRESGTYETARARTIGRAVAREAMTP